MARFSVALRNATLELINGLIGAGAKIVAYTGNPPAHPGLAATGTVLFTLLLDDPPATLPPVDAAFSFRVIGPVTAESSGSVGYLRIEDSEGAGYIDIHAGEVTISGAVAQGSKITCNFLNLGLPVGS